MVAPWSPRGRLVVASWSPHGRPECLSVVIFHRLDPYKLGDCASWSHIWRPPAPYRFFLRRTLDPYGGTRGKSHVYILPEISDPKIAPSSPRVHPEYTPSSPRVHLQSTTGSAAGSAAGKGPRSRTPSCGFGDRCVAITLDPLMLCTCPLG